MCPNLSTVNKPATDCRKGKPLQVAADDFDRLPQVRGVWNASTLPCKPLLPKMAHGLHVPAFRFPILEIADDDDAPQRVPRCQIRYHDESPCSFKGRLLTTGQEHPASNKVPCVDGSVCEAIGAVIESPDAATLSKDWDGRARAALLSCIAAIGLFFEGDCHARIRRKSDIVPFCDERQINEVVMSLVGPSSL
jgi:hypothetical protein